MRIISSFVDYYDHIQGLSGGGDPKVVYYRNPPKETPDLSGINVYLPTNQLPVFLRKKTEDEVVNEFAQKHGIRYITSIKVVFVAGRAFEIYKRDLVQPIQRIGKTAAEDVHALDAIKNKEDRERAASYVVPEYQLRSVYKSFEDGAPALEMTRKAGIPVFATAHTHGSNHFMDDRIPRLGELGFPRIIEASQLYQEIAYCITSLIPRNPDTMPQVHRTDKEKVESHGFDTKRSFRPKMR